MSEPEPASVDGPTPAPSGSGPKGARRGLKVLYIIGNQRSGSTLLVKLLGELDAVFGAGELYNFWDRSLRKETARCSCGVAVRTCDVWSAVLERMADTGPRPDPVAIRTLQRRAVGPTRLAPGQRSAPAEDYRRIMARFYRAIAEETGSSTVVDSSKSPAYAATLAGLPGITSGVIHLVRDPRGIAYSRQRGWKHWERSPDGVPPALPTLTLARIVLAWVRTNLAAEAVVSGDRANAMRLRYEDLVGEPAASLGRVAELAGLAPGPWPLQDGHTARVGTQHVAAGNPSRLRSGSLVLREDRAWVHGLPLGQRRLASALSAPLLGRYGYRLGVGRSEATESNE